MDEQIKQMEVTFQGGVGMSVTGISSSLMNEVIRAYKGYCDSYKRHITESSLKAMPFSVTANGGYQDILFFFVPFSKENETILKLKDYGVDYFEGTRLDGKPDDDAFFATYDRKAVNRIVKELDVTPRYVYVTFWNAGLAEDRSSDSGLTGYLDFGREVVRSIWYKDKFRYFDDKHCLDTIITKAPTLENINQGRNQARSVNVLKQMADALEDWGMDANQLITLSENELKDLYNRMLDERMEIVEQFGTEVSEQLLEELSNRV